MSWAGVLGLAAALLVADFVYLAWYIQWEARQTRGLAYFGRSLTARRALKRAIRVYSLPAKPLVYLLAFLRGHRSTMPAFEYAGVSGPPRVSSPEVFARAKEYQPRAEDVFVATQMRCGTTWMQQLVYEILMRGRGDLTDQGHGHLYALSPWIDGVDSVSIDQAPLVGDPPRRIIKTHLSTSLCPYSDEAKYVYVARHPVSCFASIVDYTRSMAGPLAPPVERLADWFCSDRMYWQPWPQHVAGWCQWAEHRPNVLFVHYEEMKRDFQSVRNRVAAFLGCELSTDEKRRVDERCTFAYMKDREEVFEMAPPTMFSVVGGAFMASGKASRHDDVTPAIRRRILDYCRNVTEVGRCPAYRFYSDLAAPEVFAT